MHKDVECPYCGEGVNIDHDDGRGYDEGILHNQECVKCGKTFVFTTSISYYYDAEKADCLNGSDHKFTPSKTFPKRFTRMVCSDCDEERKPTEEEWLEILKDEPVINL